MTVVVATFGDDIWPHLAQQRAIPSAEALDVPVVHSHAGTLHAARNLGLTDVTTKFVCFLDADDELEAGYFDAMSLATADLRAPAVRYVTPDFEQSPRMPRVAGHGHDCVPECLREGNWLVIGTVARTDIVKNVGGFRGYDVYEDYDLWARCWQAGASIEPVRDAVYRAHVRPDSRNRGPSRDVKHATHQAIAEANGLAVPA